MLYRDGRAVGRLRYSDPELTEALNLADGLARSPASSGRQRRKSRSGGLGLIAEKSLPLATTPGG